MPALPFLVVNQNLSNFLQCQRVFRPLMWLGILMNPISIFLFWLLITKLQLGVNGGALAITLCDILRAALNFIAVHKCGHPDSLPRYCTAEGWKQAFDVAGWIELLRLSLPGALTIWCEWWAWEVAVVMAGWLCSANGTTAGGDEKARIIQLGANTTAVTAIGGGYTAQQEQCAELAAQPVLGNTMVLGFMLTFGFGTAAATHVGNLLGAGEPERARLG